MKLYKDSTNKPFSFSVDLPLDKPLDLGSTYYKIAVSEKKLKHLITKLTKTKLDIIQTDKLLRFQHYQSGSVGRYEFLTGEYVLSEQGLLEKAATIKRFENLPLGNEFKKAI